MKKIYTIGYTGRKPDQLLQIAETLNATICDIRFAPRSRVAYWNAGPLAKFLGNRYASLKQFGNQNYKGEQGPQIIIHNYQAGREALERMAGSAVILMCACEEYHTCHRHTVAEMLKRDGYEIEEIGKKWQIPVQEAKPVEPQLTQGKLF